MPTPRLPLFFERGVVDEDDDLEEVAFAVCRWRRSDMVVCRRTGGASILELGYGSGVEGLIEKETKEKVIGDDGSLLSRRCGRW